MNIFFLKKRNLNYLLQETKTQCSERPNKNKIKNKNKN